MNILQVAQFTSPFRSKLIIKSFKGWIKKRDNILDIGCGTGITSIMIKKSFRSTIIGCDIVNYLTVDLPFHKIPRQGKLPFKDKSFDKAILNDVLHHTSKSYQINIIKEGLRVSRQLLIFEVEPTFFGKVFDIILNNLHYHGLETPLTFRDSEEWANLFEKMEYIYSIKSVKAPFWYPFSHIAMLVQNRQNKNR